MNPNAENAKLFSKDSTQIAKGIAVILLVFHHLFLSRNLIPLYDWTREKQPGIPLINHYAVQAKVCVAIFIFLSGYGIYLSLRKQAPSVKNYYRDVGNRIASYLKIVIFIYILTLIFESIFREGFIAVYSPEGLSLKTVFYMLLDIVGLPLFLKTPAITFTWWFSTLYLLLLLLTPLTYIGIQKYPTILTALAFVLFVLSRPFTADILYYFSIYCAGMFFSKYDLLNKTLKLPHISRVYTFWCW